MAPAPLAVSLREFVEKLLLLDQTLQAPSLGVSQHGFLEKLLLTVDAAPVLLSYVDSSERYRFCNQTYERWFGVAREQLIGQSMREVLGASAYEGLRAEIQAVLAGQPMHFERVVPYRSGGTRRVKVDYLPHVQPDGRVTGFVVMVADITELLRGEDAGRLADALRESEDRLRLALWGSELGTWDLEPHTGQLHCDERYRELFFLPPGIAFSNAQVSERIHPEDRARLRTAIAEAIQPLSAGRFQAEYRTVDPATGAERWVLGRGKAFFDGPQQATRLIGTVRDITAERLARLRMERLYAVSSALSRVMLPEEVARAVVREGSVALEALTASLVQVSQDGTAFELRATHGFPEQVMTGWRSFPIDTPVMYREVYRRGQPVFYESLEHFLQDYPEQRGSPVLMGRAFAALPLRVDGRIIGAFGFTFAHERRFPPEALQFMEALGQQCALALERARLYEAERQARAEAEQLRDRLAAERGLLDAVLEQLPVGVTIAEPGGRLIRGNAAITPIWGYPFKPSETIAGYQEYQGYFPDGRPYRAEEWPLARSLLHGELVLREPVTLVHPDGSRRQIELSSTPVRNAEGEVLAGVVVSTDVTAHHQLKEALLREADLREKLLGIVSHDLRNPLQAIASSGQLLLRMEALSPPQQKKVGRILTSVRRMDHLIRDLLDFARVRGGGTLPIQRRPINLEDTCRAIVEEVQAAYPERSLALELGDGLQGAWDAHRLGQLLGNLLINALTHGSAKEPVRVRVEGAGPEVVLEVSNQGSPIPAELLPRIFEPFTRASTGGDALKGVGLGLFIVHEIVTAHGGHISVSSTAQAGTVFRVLLPRQPQA
ncbi:MAG TPA: PAS domain-containing protein [Myxococcaceae bacterium]|jgi:PAS domain S-box-containing protein